MMESDRCRDIRPWLPEVALGTLDATEYERVYAHLGEGCTACAQELEALVVTFVGLPLAGEPVPLPEGAEARLREAARATKQSPPIPPIQYAKTHEARLLRVVVVLCMAAVASAGWWGYKQTDKVEWAQSAKQAAEAQSRSVAADYRRVRDRLVPAEALAGLVTDPTSIVVDLFDNADIARGRAVLDWPRKRALIVPPTQPPPPGTVFVLWIRSGDVLQRIGPLPTEAEDAGGPLPFVLPEVGGPGATLELYATPEDDVDAETPTGNRLVTGATPSPEPTLE